LAGVALIRFQWGVLPVVLGSALAGMAWTWLR
jgi:hypothetical protein